jgi:CRP-like cAMP-binding protein
MTEITYNRNNVIVKEGCPIDGIYFIRSGEFEITKKLKPDFAE